MNLDSNLNQLEVSELVRRLADEDAAYLFNHTLVQETAQKSLLNQERRRLHREVAEVLENLYAGHLEDIAARLFQHYDAAGIAEKTIAYAERAGDIAFRLSAHQEAIAAYQRALELVRTQVDCTAQWIRLMTQLGRTYELDANYDAAIAVYRETRDEARLRADRPIELAALVQLAKVLAVAAMRYDPKQAQAISLEALELARELDDKRAEAQVLWTLMLLNIYGEGGARQGVAFGEQSLALARESDLREQMAYTLNDLFYTYLNLGETERMRASLEQARELWRELDNKPMLADNLNASGMDRMLYGEFNAAFAFAHQARALAQSIDNRWGETTSYLIEGYANLERGALAHARDAFEMCTRLGDPIGVHGPVVMVRYELASLYAFLGDTARGEEIARVALERTHKQALDWNAWACATLAYVLEQRGDWSAADEILLTVDDAPPEHFFERMLPMGAVLIVHAQVQREMRRGKLGAAHTRLEQMLARLRRSEFQVLIPRALNELAQVAIQLRAWDTARSALDEAQARAEALDLRRTRLEIAATRIEWEHARGNAESVRAATAHARAVLDALLEWVPPELRESFQRTLFAQKILQNA